MDIKFSDWLIEQMRSRDWSQSDLARASGLTRQSISYYISDRSKQPDEFAIQKIAKALKLPLEEVYRAAGILPPKPNSDPLTEEGLYILQQLEKCVSKCARRTIRIVGVDLEIPEIPPLSSMFYRPAFFVFEASYLRRSLQNS